MNTFLKGLAVMGLGLPLAMADPLPSWQPGDARAAIIDFVEATTDPASSDFVPGPARIAVFDNDGTLWSEQPAYFQLLFALDRLSTLAEEDPALLTSDALKAAAEGDLPGVMAGGMEGLEEVIAASHAGLSVEAFQAEVRDWLDEARHPATGLAYTDMVYQPMLELLRYLRDEGYATYIVSGGGLHFLRAFAEQAYGIPPQQVIGSTGHASYQDVDDAPTILKEAGIAFVDDGPGKPVAIDTRIGRRPIFAAGNSDGDFEMLAWTTAGEGPRFGLLVHHTDGEREYAYDRDSHIGGLARGLDEADERGWRLVDMAADWRRIYPEAP
ncbi:HAD family hydrolase [Halomonas sp. 1390]|uniref:HAD family hydrolase n=1 Tax=Halomonas sp. B23F22_3 TaxID=3459516 RepID=UPI00373E79C5